jgi:hypothetical protein
MVKITQAEKGIRSWINEFKRNEEFWQVGIYSEDDYWFSRNCPVISLDGCDSIWIVPRFGDKSGIHRSGLWLYNDEGCVRLVCWSTGKVFVLKGFAMDAEAIKKKNFAESGSFRRAFYRLDYEALLVMLVVMCGQRI